MLMLYLITARAPTPAASQLTMDGHALGLFATSTQVDLCGVNFELVEKVGCRDN